ncbi:MAG: TPM domain-containing protein [Acidobacteria bacterium]|nr:TPM domain-containing protein [Acidobacteriota bacterium]
MRTLVTLILLFTSSVPLAALEVPSLRSRVTDQADLLSPEQEAQLESKLAEFEQQESTQIAVLIIPSLEGEVLEDFSHRAASQWQLGQKGRDNGALLLVALQERRVRIEVGYGLEPKLTDALSRRIIDQEIVPRFQQGNFFEGIDAGITAMMGAVRGTYAPLSTRDKAPQFPSPLIPLFLFLLWSLFWSRRSRRSRSLRRRSGHLHAEDVWMMGGPRYPGSFGGGFRSGGGFSGGGGSFGGGGASGRW